MLITVLYFLLGTVNNVKKNSIFHTYSKKALIIVCNVFCGVPSLVLRALHIYPLVVPRASLLSSLC